MGRGSEALKARWADPEFRAKQATARERNRAQAAEIQRQRWQDPDFRKRYSEVCRRKSDHYTTAQGYRMLRYQDGHPLASRYGELLEHRKVLYDKIGPGSHVCYICGKEREWGGSRGIHVDHLDNDKLNNAPENLEPTCKKCNGDRGKGVM